MLSHKKEKGAKKRKERVPVTLFRNLATSSLHDPSQPAVQLVELSIPCTDGIV